jgi:hypothetical protein
MAIRYGLDGPGIESPWWRDFPHSSKPALRPTQPPLQWLPCLSPGVKRLGRCHMPEDQNAPSLWDSMWNCDDRPVSIAVRFRPQVLEYSQTESCLINLCVCMCVRVIAETEHSQDWIKTCLNCNMLYCPILPFWSLPEKFAFSSFFFFLNRYVHKEDSVFWKLKENVLFFLLVT